MRKSDKIFCERHNQRLYIAGYLLMVLGGNLCANGICAACMMIVPLGLNTAAFFAVYLIYGIANIISQAAVPVGVLQSTPTRDLPFISSARMFACSGATCIMIPIFGTWTERSRAGGVMLVAALLFVAAGICFNRQYRDEIKDE